MRIAVDIGPLRPPFTGVANFTLFLLDALLREEPDLSIAGFGGLRWKVIDRGFLQHTAENAQKELEGTSGIPVRITSGTDRELMILQLKKQILSLGGAQYAFRKVRRTMFEYGSIFGRFSLFHAFNYCPPGPAKIPIIPVVYDLSVFRYPDLHPVSRVRAMQELSKYIAMAPIVHTISEFTASEITDVFGVDRSRILVTYPGLSPIFRAQNGPALETLAQFDLISRGYALTVATLEPRKNLRTLVAAYARLPVSLRVQMPLCIVGGHGWGNLELPPQSRQLQSDGSIRFLGYASDAQLRDLYAGARIVLYPSLYEGFGMPVIEAMACGAPVAASTTSSLPEAIGKVGRLIHPLDVDAWTAELFCAATDIGYGNEHTNAARRAHALSFTWQRAAGQTIRMYQAIAK